MSRPEPDHVLILCPYCGNTQTAPKKCEECGGLFEPLSRKATQIAMGPWYIRDKKRPFRPGCSYEVLQKQINAGRIKPTTIMRGPTTRQFWSVARNIPGVAHLLGYCHQCGEKVDPLGRKCPSCGEAFKSPKERNELGIQYTTLAEAAKAQRALDAEVAKVTGVLSAASGNGSRGPGDSSPGADLLDEVLGVAAPRTPVGKKPAPAVADDDEDNFLPGPLLPARPAAADAQAEAAAPVSLHRGHHRSGRAADAASAGPQFGAIDFSPSEDAANGIEAAAPAPGSAPGIAPGIPGAPASRAPASNADVISNLQGSSRRLGVMTWVFIAFNVLMLAAVVYLLVGPPIGAPANGTGGGSDAGTPGAVDNQPKPKPPIATTGGTPRSQPDGPTPTPAVNPFDAQVKRADELRLEGKLSEALAILLLVRDTAPANMKPTNLDTLINQVENERTKNQATNFFGLPTD